MKAFTILTGLFLLTSQAYGFSVDDIQDGNYADIMNIDQGTKCGIHVQADSSSGRVYLTYTVNPRSKNDCGFLMGQTLQFQCDDNSPTDCTNLDTDSGVAKVSFLENKDIILSLTNYDRENSLEHHNSSKYEFLTTKNHDPESFSHTLVDPYWSINGKLTSKLINALKTKTLRRAQSNCRFHAGVGVGCATRKLIKRYVGKNFAVTYRVDFL
jgi:hypothetical protein